MKSLFIQHNKPTLGREEVSAAGRAIKSGWVAAGEEVKNFEDEFSVYLNGGQGKAAAVSSGTAALYLALIGLGIGRGAEVIMPTYTCSAVLNAVLMADATPVLADINEDDLNLSYSQTVKKINHKTKAIILTHTFGLTAEIDKFSKLNLPIIEDCAQSIGAKYQKKLAGDFGTISVFSFYASKVFTTGYGGLVFSNDKKIIEKIRDYRQYDGRRNYKPRFNFLMSDINAAIGREQLKKLRNLLNKRKIIADEYKKVLSPENYWPDKIEGREANYYRFLLKTNQVKTAKDQLNKRGVETVIPIETHELLHRYLKKSTKDFPVSEKAAKTTLSLPIFPSLSPLEINVVKRALQNIKL